MSDHAPLVGFGAAPAMVYFSVERDPDSGNLPGWSTPGNIHVHVIPGAFPPRSSIEVVSIEPSVATWHLWLPNRAAYHALLARLTTAATLTVVANTQMHPGTYYELHGFAYEDLPQTTLIGLDNELIASDGVVEVDATFMRQVDPVTMAVIAQ